MLARRGAGYSRSIRAHAPLPQPQPGASACRASRGPTRARSTR